MDPHRQGQTLAHDPCFGHKALLRALKSLRNIEALGEQPLARQLFVARWCSDPQGLDTAIGRGMALREALQAAIELIKPPLTDAPDWTDKAWRPWLILTERFRAGRSPRHIADRLHVSVSTYDRELQTALDLLADVLIGFSVESQATAQEALPPRQPDPISALARPSPRWTLFMAPPLPVQTMVGRDALLARARHVLLRSSDHDAASGRSPAVALHGLPGVGKTALAIQIAHDPQIRNQYPDGTLWVGLGTQPDIFRLQAEWCMALGFNDTVMARLTTVEARARALHSAIGARRFLLVIDDAWHIQDALAFRVGGPGCAYILTTRLLDLALGFAGPAVLRVDELDTAGGLALLAQCLPDLTPADDPLAQDLVRWAGGLPLSLVLMGGFLRHARQTGALAQAIERLRSARGRLSLQQHLPPLELGPHAALDTPVSLADMIRHGENALSRPARRALLALSLLPAKPNTFTMQAALAVIDNDDSRDGEAEPPAAPPAALTQSPAARALAELTGAGLVERIGDRLALHQSIHDYASLQLMRQPAGPGDDAGRSPQHRMAAFFAAFAAEHENDFVTLDRERANLEAAFDIACERGFSTEALRWCLAMRRYFIARGLEDAWRDRLERAVEAATPARDPDLLAELFAQLAARTRSEAHAGLAWALAQQHGAPGALASVHYFLGEWALENNDLSRVWEHWQAGLQVAQERDLASQELRLLVALGRLTAHLKGHLAAEPCYHRALALAKGRRAVARRSTASLMIFYAASLLAQGQTAAAEASLLRAQALCARQGIVDLAPNIALGMADLRLAADDLAGAERWVEACAVGIAPAEILLGGEWADESHLSVYRGILARRRRQYDLACDYLERGLEQAQAKKLILVVLKARAEQGELWLDVGRAEQARTVFEQLLADAASLGVLDSIAAARFGLARVAALQGDLAAARQHANGSLEIYRQSGHVLAKAVAAWLAEK